MDAHMLYVFASGAGVGLAVWAMSDDKPIHRRAISIVGLLIAIRLAVTA